MLPAQVLQLARRYRHRRNLGKARRATRENSSRVFDYEGDMVLRSDDLTNMVTRYGEVVTSAVIQIGAAEIRRYGRIGEDDVSGRKSSATRRY